MTATIAFVAGVVGLLVGGHLVVRSASTIGSRFGLTPLVIGLTIVAAGTSAPELAVVLQSVAADDTPLAVGSIIGSNIANVLLVLGLVATLGVIHVTNRVVRVDIPIMIAASVGLLVVSLDNEISRLDGVVLFGGLVAFVGWTLRAAPKLAPESFPAVDERPGDSRSAWRNSKPGLGRDLIGLIAGIGVLAVAARFVVSGAESIAVALGVPELIVGLTIVALGTSAPEIVTTVIAAVQGRRDLAVGNAVGSNIFNILLVLGVSSVLADGIAIGRDAIELDLPIMVAAAVACLPIVFWDNRLTRWEGMVFVGYYAAYLIFLSLDATGHRASDPFALVMVAFVLPLTVVTLAVVVVRQRRAAIAPDQAMQKYRTTALETDEYSYESN
ncbi:MAG: calcium/sodium antiporter [Acidimicrobiales bacterium]|nr:calcium/sodium antiporter [Acidimicrobiales bacterium]